MQVSLGESALLPVRLLKPSFHCATLNKNSWATDTTMEEFFPQPCRLLGTERTTFENAASLRPANTRCWRPTSAWSHERTTPEAPYGNCSLTPG